jgi:hypothetical protein
MNKKSFNTRSFLSIGTFLFFIVLALSGIALHVTDHKPDTFFKVFSMVAHNISAVGFLIFSIGHILKNWKTIKSYMSGKAKKMISKEMLISIIILILILALCMIKAVGMSKAHGLIF